jgi:hypothetical protein
MAGDQVRLRKVSHLHQPHGPQQEGRDGADAIRDHHRPADLAQEVAGEQRVDRRRLCIWAFMDNRLLVVAQQETRPPLVVGVCYLLIYQMST